MHVVKHSRWAKGFSCRQGYFPVSCMPLVDQGGLFLGLENVSAGKESKKEVKKRENHKTLERLLAGIKTTQNEVWNDAAFVKVNHVAIRKAKSYTERGKQRERDIATQTILQHKSN